MTQKLTSDILAVCLLVLLLVLLVLLVLWWTLRRSRYKPTAASHRHTVSAEHPTWWSNNLSGSKCLFSSETSQSWRSQQDPLAPWPSELSRAMPTSCWSAFWTECLFRSKLSLGTNLKLNQERKMEDDADLMPDPTRRYQQQRQLLFPAEVEVTEYCWRLKTT